MTAEPDDLPVATLPAADLLGLLTDLERTAGRDATLPMLRGIMLHTGPKGLYATSTNRFILGQGWEPCVGELPPTFLDLEGVALARALLAQARAGQDADLIHIGGAERLRINVRDVGATMVPLRERYSFPDVAKLTAQHSEGEVAQLSPTLLAGLTTIGRRRGCSLRFALGQALKPATVDIGNRYRALIMPIRDADPEPYQFHAPERNTR